MLRIIQSFISSSGGGERGFTYFNQLLGVAGFVQILDPKFKTFSRLFTKTMISLFTLKVINSWSTETYKNAGTKLFSWCTANAQWPWFTADIRGLTVLVLKLLILWLNVLVTGETEWGLTTGKNNTRLFNIFLNGFSRLFPGLENCFANFTTSSIFNNQDSVLTLGVDLTHWN